MTKEENAWCNCKISQYSSGVLILRVLYGVPNTVHRTVYPVDGYLELRRDKNYNNQLIGSIQYLDFFQGIGILIVSCDICYK